MKIGRMPSAHTETFAHVLLLFQICATFVSTFISTSKYSNPDVAVHMAHIALMLMVSALLAGSIACYWLPTVSRLVWAFFFVWNLAWIPGELRSQYATAVRSTNKSENQVLLNSAANSANNVGGEGSKIKESRDKSHGP